MVEAYIYGINGPVIKVRGNVDFKMTEMVLVGNEQLIGEVISVEEDETIVQVYEVTTGLKIQEPVISTGKPLSVQLGPGIIGNVFDGIQRPLKYIQKLSGDFIGRGMKIQALNPDKQWDAHIIVKKGDKVSSGQIVAEVKETSLVTHKVMIPPYASGEVVETKSDGLYRIHDTIIKIKNENNKITEITLVQEWPVRISRKYKRRITVHKPLITGQRVIDSLYPIAKGGSAAIPGGFGTGKTMTQHQLAKWSDADIIVYIGCGERGNEITDVLEQFPELIDPKSGEPLMNRTVLIANTSNMPVAAREASIYTGITLAEYYRDMGYHVAVMADSTSRWAEALREISGRLEEMPAEEGFPAYLPSRLSQFYERASYVENLNNTEGSVSIIGAVSPAGGDFSEPVTQNTKRFIRCFWALDRQLAYSRHYPAIHWLNSYSEYIEDLSKWYNESVDEKFINVRAKFIELLQEESKLMEIVKLIGSDVLPEEQKLTLEIAKVIRLGFLQQNAFHDVDTYVPIKKQYQMMNLILHLYDKAKVLVEEGIPLSQYKNTGIFSDLINMKYHLDNSEEADQFKEYSDEIDKSFARIKENYKDLDLRKGR